MKIVSLSFLLLFILVQPLVCQEVIQKNGKFVISESGKSYTGIFKEYDPEKRLISETSISEGLLDGLSTFYYPSGAKKELRSYLKGKKNGTWETWSEAGIKTAEATFREGKKDGPWNVWDEKGVKRYEMFYKSGGKTGTWIVWDENGKVLSREEYK